MPRCGSNAFFPLSRSASTLFIRETSRIFSFFEFVGFPKVVDCWLFLFCFLLYSINCLYLHRRWLRCRSVAFVFFQLFFCKISKSTRTWEFYVDSLNKNVTDTHTYLLRVFFSVSSVIHNVLLLRISLQVLWGNRVVFYSTSSFTIVHSDGGKSGPNRPYTLGYVN